MPHVAERLLVIGLDGGTFDILNPLMELGYLPNLRSLIDKGCWGTLMSTIPPFTAAAWSSFITGGNPGRHGIMSFYLNSSHSRDPSCVGFVNSRCLDMTIWDIMGAHGVQMCIVNVPMTYPPRPINGCMITGMLTPYSARQFTYPAELSKELENYVIDLEFIRSGKGFRGGRPPDRATLLSQVRDMSRKRGEACLKLCSERPWNLFMVVFTGVDRIQHIFWDKLVTAISRSESPETSNLIAYFCELDTMIGRLISCAGQPVTTLVISDHGFGPAPKRLLYLNVWLERLGLLERRAGNGMLDLTSWRVAIGRVRKLKALVQRLVPSFIQKAALTLSKPSDGVMFDRSKTKAYCVPIYAHICGIKINPMSVGEEERQKIIGYIESQAHQLVDEQTGKRVIKTIARRESLFSGPHVDNFPDLVLVLDPDYAVTPSLASSSLVEEHKHPFRTGEHRLEGIFIAAGPNIESKGKLGNIKLVDVPAIILRLMGITVPPYFDGKANVLSLSTPMALKRKAQSHAVTPPPFGNEDVYSDEDQAELEDRLRGLGYI